MKKRSLFALLAVAEFVLASLFAGCSDSTAMGTSEEGNELAERISSASEESSSSAMEFECLSSLAESSRSSSSVSENLSSSCESSSSSSEDSRQPVEMSSGSEVDGKIPPTSNGSSSSVNVNEGSARPNTLDYYLDLYNLESDSFDNGVLSMKKDIDGKVSSDNPNTPPMASEFDTPWPHKIVKQNVDLLNEYFPTAVKFHSKIIAAIKNETLDENCGLYSFNVYGDGLTAAFIVAEISKSSIKVLDVPAGKCEAISTREMSRFLFYYCGELDSHPDVVHVPVETSLKDCPVYNKMESEWVNSQSLTP